MSETRRGMEPAATSVEEDPNAAVVCSSPPCFMHELDPSYFGYFGREKVSVLLDGLLAAEWGGAALDEARLRATLHRRLEALGGCPDHAPGASCGVVSGEPAAAAEAAGQRPDRLASTIRDALPRIYDDALRRDLEQVLGVLERGGRPRQDSVPGGS